MINTAFELQNELKKNKNYDNINQLLIVKLTTYA